MYAYCFLLCGEGCFCRRCGIRSCSFCANRVSRLAHQQILCNMALPPLTRFLLSFFTREAPLLWSTGLSRRVLYERFIYFSLCRWIFKRKLPSGCPQENVLRAQDVVRTKFRTSETNLAFPHAVDNFTDVYGMKAVRCRANATPIHPDMPALKEQEGETFEIAEWLRYREVRDVLYE